MIISISFSRAEDEIIMEPIEAIEKIKGAKFTTALDDQLSKIDRLAKKYSIKEITVYKDHILIQIDKERAKRDISLYAKDPSTFRVRQSELEKTGRVELEVGEAILYGHAHHTSNAYLKEIKNQIAYIEVKDVYSDMGDNGIPIKEILEEFKAEINLTYKSPEGK